MLEGWPPPVFDPAGPYAASITWLAWILLGLAAVVLAIVVVAMWVALKGSEERKRKLGGTTTIWIGGIAFPVIVLSVLLVWGLSLTRSLSADDLRGDEMRIRVVGEMWWWRVTYLDQERRPILLDANELHIPTGEPIVLELSSADVIHSFWVPRLSGKLDMIPGRWNTMKIQADEPGVYGGQCAEYCGGPHALMGLVVVAHAPDEFEKFLRERLARLATPEALTPLEARGALLFQSAGCAACHRIAGTPANGMAGPDLTFVGTRRTLGAGIMPNNLGTMMGWIGNSQAIKPQNRMPPYTVLTGEELAALAAYLEAQR